MSILAFGDEQDFHAALARAAKNHEHTIEHAETATVAGNWFDSMRPELLVLCFESVEKSEIGLKSLYAHSELAAFTEFKTLLLCSKNETDEALRLCLDRVFDDYQIAKPLQDSAQLEWRLQSLMLGYRSTNKAAIKQISAQLEKIKIKLQQSSHELSSPASPLNTHNTDKLASMQSQLQERLLSLIAVPNNSTQNQIQPHLTAEINNALSGFSGDINDLLNNLVKTIMMQYASLDSDINSTSKVIKHASKPVIMVVDDNAGFREPVTQMLLDEGYKVIISDAGSKAVGMIIREGPELVLMDYQMPAMNGIETIKQVKELLNGARTPSFIMVTGNSAQDVVKQAKAVGVDRFLVKPVRRTDLLEKVKDLLGKRGLS